MLLNGKGFERAPFILTIKDFKMDDIKLKHYAVLTFRFKSSSDDIMPVTVWKSVNFFNLKSRFKKIKHLVEYHVFSHESEIY